MDNKQMMVEDKEMVVVAEDVVALKEEETSRFVRFVDVLVMQQ